MRPMPLSCCRKICVLRAMRARLVGRQRERLVERVGMQRLRVAGGGRHRLDLRAHHVVPDILRGERPAGRLAMRAQRQRLLVLRLGTCPTRSHQSRRAARILATSMKKFMPIAQKNDSRGANASMSSPAASPARMYSTPSAKRVGELEIGRRPGLLHVVAGDRDRVELRHVLRRMAEDVGDDAHRARGRVDVGVAHHELFEDVVLDGAGELVLRAPPAPPPRRCRAPAPAAPPRSSSSTPKPRRAGCDRTSVRMSRIESIATRRLARRRPRRAGGRNRSRGGWRGRRRRIGPSGRRRGCGGKRRSILRRWRSPHTGGSSMAG